MLSITVSPNTSSVPVNRVYFDIKNIGNNDVVLVNYYIDLNNAAIQQPIQQLPNLSSYGKVTLKPQDVNESIGCTVNPSYQPGKYAVYIFNYYYVTTGTQEEVQFFVDFNTNPPTETCFQKEPGGGYKQIQPNEIR